MYVLEGNGLIRRFFSLLIYCRDGEKQVAVSVVGGEDSDGGDDVGEDGDGGEDVGEDGDGGEDVGGNDCERCQSCFSRA